MQTKKLRPAAVRIDGGKRVDLKARRERRGIVVAPREYTKPRMAKPPPRQMEGAVERQVRIKDLQGGSRSRTLTQTIRARPGTFSWRFGRDTQTALHHAGSHFAQLWEKAGIAVASSADFLRGVKSGYPQGISEARLVAMQKVAGIVTDLGRYSTERLIDYCVIGLTTAEIARKHGQKEREIAAVLHQDLRSLAFHLRYLS